MARKKWNLLSRLIDVLFSWVEERIPLESKLKADAEQMLQALNLKADATSFAMSRADMARETLTKNLQEYEALERQAKEFLREQDKEAAERCVVLQLQAKKEIERLTLEYQQLQHEAEQLAAEFAEQKVTTEEKVREVPRLQQDLRLINAQEKLEQARAQFSIEGAEYSFDATAQEIEIRKRQLTNKTLLASDKNARLDARIRGSLQQKEISDTLKALEEEVFQEGVIDAEYSAPKEQKSLIDQARKALEAPRYPNTLSPEKKSLKEGR